ncbi:PREDICTED: uncharacterized protein LOC109115989 [Tarenaya hassleriana]|uniref:uncharacterized protein LOC109115989 n=1 Tax=Tarenaya hassleriana TaxID=28532 RepID=UPI0008FCFC89|nr:PREDICTED: uncharacterized protein LOC109115989 [Tarenaya hassleriana]
MAAHHLLRPRAPTIFDQTRNLSDLVEAIISLLNTLNPQNPRPQCFVSCPLNQFSPYLSPGLVNEVINRQTNPKRALFFFNWASNPSPNPQNYSHSRSCYAAITDLLLSRSLFSVAASILEKSGNFSDFFVSRFVKASGDRGNLKGAVFWFHRAKSIGDGNCLYSYNALLGVLVRANKMSLARSIFNQMLNDGIVKPDVSAY